MPSQGRAKSIVRAGEHASFFVSDIRDIINDQSAATGWDGEFQIARHSSMRGEDRGDREHRAIFWT
jgi:hypothetical protein